MYNSVKSIARRVIPGRLLARYECMLRGIIAIRYRGNRHRCNICGYGLRAFVELNDEERLCPRCGSLSRARRLFIILENEMNSGERVLHFSPPGAIRRAYESRSDIQYITTDYAGEFAADKCIDITDIDESENTYDKIICYHILEHIEEDRKAMTELLRILKPGGSCFIQTPFSEKIYEDQSIISPEERLIQFGQEDHVRVYSVEGLQHRLTEQGFSVEVLLMNGDTDDYYGLRPGEYVLKARKP